MADCSGYSNVATVVVTIVQVPPNAPSLTGPGSTSTDFAFTLSWTAVSHASSYELQQRRLPNQSFSTVYSGADLSWTVQRGPATYEYQVRACSAAGCSGWSAIHTVIVLPSGG